MWRTGKRSLVPATGIDGSSHAGIAYWVIEPPSFGVGLQRRGRRRERGQFVAGGFDPGQRRIRRHVDIEPARVRDLRYEADVGERRRIGVTEPSCPGVARQ